MPPKSLIPILLITVVLIAGCADKDKSITKEQAYQIGLNELIDMGLDTSKTGIKIFPENPFTLDSIKTGVVRRPFWGDYTEWLEHTEGRLNNKTFWRCVSYVIGYMDARYDIYVDVKTGDVLYVDGGTPRVRKWRENHGMKQKM